MAFKKGPGNRRLRVALLLIVVCVVFGPMHGNLKYNRYILYKIKLFYASFATSCVVNVEAKAH